MLDVVISSLWITPFLISPFPHHPFAGKGWHASTVKIEQS